MKIAYCVLGTFNSGGMERVLANKANYLTANGHDITIITTDQQARKPYFELDHRIQTVDLGINYTDSLKKNIVQRLLSHLNKQAKHKKKLSTLLIERKYDLVISLFDHDASFLTSIQDGSKKILEIHFSRFKRLQYGRSGIMGWIDRYRSAQDLRLVKKFSRFVVLTEEDKLYWGNLPNIQVIPNANSFVPKSQSGLSKKQVIAVGRYDAQKQFDDLIHAWRMVADTAPEWVLKIYGQGPQKRELERLIAQLGLEKQVILHPSVTNIEEAYINSSAIAMTSRYEGLPMALLEGQVCGLPMVSYACKCGPRDIIDDGVNGFLVKEGDRTEMANKLLKLISSTSLRVEMGKQALRMSEEYREDKIMDQWLQLFAEVLDRKNGPGVEGGN